MAEAEERTTIQCKKCGRAVWSDHVNKAGNCVLCSPPHEAHEDEDKDEDKDEDEDKPEKT